MTLGQLLALVGLARLLALWVIGVEILQYASFAWLCVPVEIMAENGFQGNIWIWPFVIVFAAGIACCVLSCVRWCRQYITN